MKLTESVLGLEVDGAWRWKERPLAETLQKDPAAATRDDITALSWRELLRLFHAAPAPRMESMSGEYRAVVLPAGIFGPLASFFTHTFFGPGRWQGKAFRPHDQQRGEGYNLFSAQDSMEDPALRRTRRFDTAMAPSRFDGRPSFCLDYGSYNRFLIHSMKDEIRQLGPELFLGLGTMAAGGGALNPAPFVLFGEPRPWQGPQQS